jgi:D-glycero-D-manno-heptose 1,7-bisphosphate phosphatase
MFFRADMYKINWSNRPEDSNKTNSPKKSMLLWSDEKKEISQPIPMYNSSNNIAPKCVIGLDRDGVINVDRGTYTWKIEDFEPIKGSLEAVAKLRRLGHKIVIITNQAGIGKGLYTESDVERVHDYMFKLLGEAGCASIDGLYYSTTNHREDIFAKPNIGMFKKCEEDNKFIKFKHGYYVGDKISDLKAAFRAGAIPVLVKTGHGEETIKELNKYANQKIKKKTIIFDNLASFADWISTKI